MRYDKSILTIVACAAFIAGMTLQSATVLAVAPKPTICANGVIVYTGACPVVPSPNFVNRCAGQVAQALIDCKKLQFTFCKYFPIPGDQLACINFYKT